MRAFLIGFVLLVVGAIVGYSLRSAPMGTVLVSDSGRGGPSRSQPRPAAAKEKAMLGVVVPRSRAAIASTIPGLLRAVHVRIGDPVEEGAILASLDMADARSRLAESRASLRVAQARIEESRSRLATGRDRLTRNQAHSGIVSDEAIAILRGEVMVEEATQEAARAEVAKERAQVEILQRALGNTELRAPFAGVVAARLLDPGALVEPGQGILVVNSVDTWIRFAVPPERIEQYALDATLHVEVEPTGLTATAKIRRIAPEVDRPSQTIFVEAEFDPNTPAATSGSLVRVHLRPVAPGPSPRRVESIHCALPSVAMSYEVPRVVNSTSCE
jgi:RND family efflux transporter MFP subunit